MRLYAPHDHSYLGWCLAKTIRRMTAAGLLRERPDASAPVTWADATAAFRQAVEQQLDREAQR
jgi:hypothetical protein